MRTRAYLFAALAVGASAAIYSLPHDPVSAAAAPVVINHECTRLSEIPTSWIETAKSSLRIAYGHTSHGSQLVDGMTGLVDFAGGGPLYAWNGDGSDGALHLRDAPFSGASDL